jgi:hypothetical protein
MCKIIFGGNQCKQLTVAYIFKVWDIFSICNHAATLIKYTENRDTFYKDSILSRFSVY